MKPVRKSSTQVEEAEEELPQVDVGSGNVFANLGVPNPEIALQKAKLVQRIRGAITEKKHSRVPAAKLLGLDPTKLAALLRWQTQRFTLDRLFQLLYASGQDVQIVVRPATK